VRDSPAEAGAWHLPGVLALRDGNRPAAEDYLRRTAPTAARIVDKHVMNLGPTHRLFPLARIIHCRRDAMDTCFWAYGKQPDETPRRIVDFLDLPWQESCSRFFETTRMVNTASFVQVRQPIYRSSVGRSAALLEHLRPLAEALGDLGPEPA
jgi:hypothetical protein